jgi:hypothetical protein
MFVGLHAMLAGATNTPELAIEPAEGEAFMKSAQNVMRHYSVETTQKTLDWIAFMGTATGIYAPRLVAARMNRSKREAPMQMPPMQGASVHPLNIVPEPEYG